MRRPSAVGKIAKDAGYCTHCRLLGLRLAIVKHLVELHTGIKGASRYQHPDQFGYCGACLITPPSSEEPETNFTTSAILPRSP
jgi:hypothetical protein